MFFTQSFANTLSAAADATKQILWLQQGSNYRRDDIRTKIEQCGLLYPLDVLLVGGTGTGKSSTLNALFGNAVAGVGDGVDPHTQAVDAYRLHSHLRFHDSAGLGDGKDADLRHSKAITEHLGLVTKNNPEHGFIDLAMVILDGGSRDLGTAFSLLEKVVLKAISADRVIVIINQADMAMKGRHWDQRRNRPEPELIAFLDEKAKSVQRRLQEATGLTIKQPICYSATCGYNLHAVIDHIYEHIPSSIRQMK
ncbi:GTPase family protein [Pseudomonas sp. A014]|uniref:GTPase family protein n=1 Tax=Pseudomonas sp. A014 TaxID=3458058 RepID=UPI0040354134